MSIKSRLKKPFPILLICLIVLFIAASITDKNMNSNYSAPVSSSPPTPTQIQNTQISGWAAWWAEDKAYNLISNNPSKIYSVSPVWFVINDDLTLGTIGKQNHVEIVSKLKNEKVRVLPSLGSELSGEKLSLFLRNNSKVNLVIESLASQVSTMGAQGVDVDLEGIKKEDKSYFTLFLFKLHNRLKKDNLQMSVTVHAQTKKVVWNGVEGQDLKWIGENADEVRIMTYDEHSADSKPGSITSYKWLKEVIDYNSKLIDKNKIVIGIPSYGYIWSKDTTKGLQYDEYNAFLKEKNYTQKKDKLSGEQVYSSADFTGWLSDSEAMKLKISQAQELGINKFIIWHLGGMDEKFFDKD